MEVDIEKALTQHQIVAIKKTEQNSNKSSVDDIEDEETVELGLTTKAVCMQVSYLFGDEKFLFKYVVLCVKRGIYGNRFCSFLHFNNNVTDGRTVSFRVLYADLILLPDIVKHSYGVCFADEKTQ